MWRVDVITIVAAFVMSALYGWGVWRARRHGTPWPIHRSLAFFGLGIGSYLLIESGFLGVYSSQLRWVFATRVALLLFIVPAGLAAGRPLHLAEASLGPRGRNRLHAVMQSPIARLFGNAVFATIVAAGVFCVFLTPLAGILRANPVAESLTGLVVPAFGLVLALPLSFTAVQTSLFLTIEFLLAFVELLIDSIPGILLRLNDTVLDPWATVSSPLSWWPTPLHDQHLAGDMLWFLAEVVDVPVLILLLIRWMRSDKREQASFDELSDEEYERLTQEHLRGT